MGCYRYALVTLRCLPIPYLTAGLRGGAIYRRGLPDGMVCAISAVFDG